MATAAQRIAALEDQLAELAAKVARLNQYSLIASVLETDAPALEAAFAAGRAHERGERPGAPRLRHMSVVGGGAS